MSQIFKRYAGVAGVCLAGTIAVAAISMAMASSEAATKAKTPRVSTQGDRVLAEQLVSKTLNVYQNYNRGSFTDIVSADYPMDRSILVNNVEQSFYAAKPVKIDFFVNTVNATGDKLAVSFRWDKSYAPRNAGGMKKRQAQCVFVYKKENEKWLLYEIKGQSPFSL